MWHCLKIRNKVLFLKFENHNGIIKWWEWKFEKQQKLEDSQNKFETVNQASSVKRLTKPVLSTFQHAPSIFHKAIVVLFSLYCQTLIKLSERKVPPVMIQHLPISTF